MADGPILVIAATPELHARAELLVRARCDAVLHASDAEAAMRVLLDDDVRLAAVLLDQRVAGAAQLTAAAAHLLPKPAIVVVSPDEGPRDDVADAFQLAKLGADRIVRASALDDVPELLDEIGAEAPPELARWVAPFLGRMGLFEVERGVRDALVAQALAVTRSRAGASRLLRVPRAVVQRVARRDLDPDDEH